MSVYALIMAGGEGKRFWPLSSKLRPKQFLSLNGEKSLITQTYERINKIVDDDNIFVVTTKSYVRETQNHLPMLKPQNILAEPVGKNTGPCIYYGCRVIAELDKDAVVIVLPADHAIKQEEKFREALRYSIKIADEKMIKGSSPLITFGIKPGRPDTGYGYIESGGLIDRSDHFESYTISDFKEKPDEKLAKEYLKSGNYYWNSGIFVWKIDAILSEYSIHSSSWDKYAQANLSDPAQIIDFYDNIEAIPVDKQILEKSEKAIVIPVNFGWSDIGTWQSLDEFERTSPDENIVKGRVITEDTRNSFILSSGDRNIVTIGVDNLIIVESEDGLLVMDKQKSQLVRDVISKIRN